ncbi:MAG: hypothetical protein K2N26_02420, partial [Oscillospiraceae bacterium]|nr:hypothetical protein [Oscillospiraceae bacterium]
DTSIASYLNDSFRFENTQMVKSETNKQKKIISVSLVGETLSADVIKLLRSQLADYGLEEYNLHVTQNVVTETDSSDKVTIILQENTISELRKQLNEQSGELSEMQLSLNEYEAEHTADAILKAMPQKTESIFPYLSDCKIGIMSDGRNDIITLTAETDKDLSEDELTTVRNWLSAESGIDRAETYITYVIPEPPETEDTESENNEE